ncbi:hypothetical protein GO491_07650 [Flavobacteriaceae bacterium Ap0902]|nr:hypothetical protein [Flavobacteriaceae bacterium Ap0902]
MSFDKYGLKPWKEFKNDLKPIKIDKSITPKNVKELFKKVEGKNYMGFEDYLSRKLILKETIFNNHLRDHYLNKEEIRHQLFPHIESVLKSPDEVWGFNWKGKIERKYIKFYKNKILVVTTEINENIEGIEINSWHYMKGYEKEARKGILIKK